jgi:hypothetical protein
MNSVGAIEFLRFRITVDKSLTTSNRPQQRQAKS